MTLLSLQGECEYQKGCFFENLSCRYVDSLPDSFKKQYHSSPEEAVQAVRDGLAWGAIYFNENFTDALVARQGLGNFDDAKTEL